MVTLLHCEAADHAMEAADPEFPPRVDPPPPPPAAADVQSVEKVAPSKRFRPRLPVVFYRLLPRARLRAVGQYIASFEYRLHSQTNFSSQKQRPLFLIMETAKSIVSAPQPIKCVEAVFVALLLTAGLPDVERFPLSFQTVLDDQVYQHIVLLVQYFGKFGAFGISRWPEFMSKDLKFDSMSSVVENYKTAYEGQHHVVEKIRVGLPVEHNTRSTNFVCWRHLELDLVEQSWKECCEAIDEFAGKAKKLWNLWIRSGNGENPWQLYIRQTSRLLANRKPSPPKAKPSESVEFSDSRNVNCRFNIQPPSSRESARVTLSLEPEEVILPPKSKKAATVVQEFCFNTVRSQFSKHRRSKIVPKEDVVARSVRSIRGAIRSLPRAVKSQSVEPPLVVSQCLLGTKYLDGTPGFDGPKACWECLRTVYRTKNEARLLLLKDKLSDLRTQGPLVGESFRVVQDIFQQLVGIGDAIASKLDGFEAAINALTDSFDAVVQSVDGQSELHSLRQLAKQLAEDMEPMQVTEPVKRPKKAVVHETPKRISSLKKIEAPPPCNWCGVFGHRMRDCDDLETEIARRVREYKNQVDQTLPNSSRADDQSENSEVNLPSHKLVDWHKNRSKMQDQNCSDSLRQNDMDSVPEVDVDQLTTPSATTTTTARTTKKKMSLVQRRLRTKLMYLLGMNTPGPQVKSRKKTNQKKKPAQF